MAAIDKIYGTKEQFIEFYSWASQHAPFLLRYFYCTPNTIDHKIADLGPEVPITNFPTGYDHWLMDNCPIAFVQSRLKEQYQDLYSSSMLWEK